MEHSTREVSDPAPAPFLSILIPAYNEERNLEPLLEFFRSECSQLPGEVEVLVDVSGSTDASAEIAKRLAQRWPAIRVLDIGRRDGLLEALVRLAGAARAPLLLRADADIDVQPGTVAALLERMRDPAVGIVSPQLGFSPGRSRIVNTLHAAYLEIHHQVSLLSPKTTVFQLFRRIDSPLPADAGVEDVALQERIEASGLRAIYAPEGMVRNAPPATLREWIRQQVRYVRALENHAARGYPAAPSTARVRVLIHALGNTLAEGRVSRVNVCLFLGGELVVRSLAAAGPLVPIAGSFDWEPVEGTKDLSWAPLGPSASALSESRVRTP
jgi:cellulose synthase/poly-beta-1,6-N-acetylglucosamine synthase-like glycosyltransferase